MDRNIDVPADYLHKVYVGVLGKLIGVYLGRPFENWTHQQILKTLGPIHYYTHEKFNLPCVVIDDDISGTFTFVRALEEHGCHPDLNSEDIGKTWLNNVVERRSVFWWGGNGISTEHTAYVNLKHKGLIAPQSGCAKNNGKTLAEQIGAQIFIDGWAMVAPGKPALAAKLARAAAMVSHDGEAVYAATLWAAMEAEAFLTSDIDHLLTTGLSFIPPDCEIAQLIANIRAWVKVDGDWQTTRDRIEAEYGYHKYSGICHVIPNHGIMILALLYGGHDFRKAMHIVNTCGWDTDCNSGNVGCLVAIMHGLSCFEGDLDWRGPIADLALISSADGGYGINNAARLTYDIAALGYKLANAIPPYEVSSAQYNFSLPGSVQGFTVDSASSHSANIRQDSDIVSGTSSLRIELSKLNQDAEPVYISTPTFTPLEVLKVSRHYDIMASPLVYPGQTLRVQISASASNTTPLWVRLRLKAYNTNNTLITVDSPESIILKPGLRLSELSFEIPRHLENMPIQQIGPLITPTQSAKNAASLQLYTLSWSGTPHMTLRRPTAQAGVENSDSTISMWQSSWISSVDKFHTSLGPSFYISHNVGEGLISHGTRDWRDYRVSVHKSVVSLGSSAGVIVRMRGLRRWYAIMFLEGGKEVGIVKARDEERTVLEKVEFEWELDIEYEVGVVVEGSEVRANVNGIEVAARDEEYEGGSIGLVISDGALSADSIDIAPI